MARPTKTYTPEEWMAEAYVSDGTAFRTADGADVVVVLDGNHPPADHVCGYGLAGDADGSITVRGDSLNGVYVFRTGDGQGDAVCSSGGAYGAAYRGGSGQGDAIRVGKGRGCACRGGSGAGDAYLGSGVEGTAARYGSGRGFVVTADIERPAGEEGRSHA